MAGITHHTATRSKARLTVNRNVYNEAGLINAIESDIANAVEEAGAEVFDIFLNEYVIQYAYSRGNTWYVPSGEFLNSWRRTQTRKAGNVVGTSIIYDPTSMSADFETWKHASQFEGWGSAVPFMADLLNTRGSIGMPWNDREEAYWDKFVSEIFESGELDRLISVKLQGL